MPDPTTSPVRRNRSATMVAIPPPSSTDPQAGPSRPTQLGSTPRNITEPVSSAAAAALSSHLAAQAQSAHAVQLDGVIDVDAVGNKRPRLSSSKTSHARISSWPSPPPLAMTAPSAPAVPTMASLDHGEPLFPKDRVNLALYTYRPNNSSTGISQPSPLPTSSAHAAVHSMVQFAYDSLPWKVRPGDYLQIKRVQRDDRHSTSRTRGMGGMGGSGPMDGAKAGGEAIKGLSRKRNAYIFRAGEDTPNIPMGQIHLPESVASAFRFQHRSEVEVIRIFEPADADIDHLEIRFSQYLGRADMWRLAMSLEGLPVHVGERLSLAGGAVRAEVQAVYKARKRYASGIVTAKTKTIYRSRSAQVYLFIQLCKETWEFDEDGERYYEKVVHGFLPKLFKKWNDKGTSHLVTIVLFARVHYTDEEVQYLTQNDLDDGLIKDYSNRWCKDFFRVAIDFERRNDWNLSLAEIKTRLERSEREILLDYHMNLLAQRHPDSTAKRRIVGKWSFAYEGNVLEAVNLALNPFDEHYIDRDLNRTGLNIAIITPGTGHFAVDKNLLRMTTERMIDHGTCLELVCLTKMPLHSAPLFSYVSKKPRRPVWEIANSGVKTKPATPDLLYFDAHLSSATDCELADCYSIPKWINPSFYSKTHDKPFRKDRFVPRCKMYEIQMLGILDHNLTTVTVPLLDMDSLPKSKHEQVTSDDRRAAREDFDADIFRSAKIEDVELGPVRSRDSGAASAGVAASYQSSRLLAVKAAEDRKNATPPDPPSSMAVTLQPSSPRTQRVTTAESSPQPFRKTIRSGSSASRSPLDRVRDLSPFEPLDLQRTELRAASPAPSSLSMGMSTTTATRARSHSRVSEPSADASSGQSTPKMTPSRKLNTKSSKSSFGSRFGANWLLTALSGRSQPSFPIAAPETVGRTDVSSVTGNRSPSPISSKPPSVFPRPVPGAPIVTPSTPSPSKIGHPVKQLGGDVPVQSVTQPVPIAVNSKRSRLVSDEEPIKSFRNSYKASRSPSNSWQKAVATNFNRSNSHITVNPCNPNDTVDTSFGEGRRWQHLSANPEEEGKHLVKWKALTAPASLPLTTDFMPSTKEIQDYYEFNSYDIACYPDQVSFLVRADAANINLPLAVMREMASQRLSQNFQFITLPHDHNNLYEDDGKLSTTRKVLLPGDSTKDGLRVGGASEVLRDEKGAIYLLWSNHIHRLAFDSMKQSVTVQRFVRKLTYSMEPVRYQCLVWPAQMNAYQTASAVFKYPNVEAKLNFNYLDRLIAGEEEDLTSNLRYWRTRYILIPSDRDPVAGVVPKGEEFNQAEILISGAFKVLEILSKNQWKAPGASDVPLRLLPTTFDPSACVLDDGLMIELDRLNKGEEQHPVGRALEGMTLQTVGEMMCQPNNGLVIRDRWWNINVHEDSFTGEQFCDWLLKTFSDIKSIEEAAEWGRSLFDKGLIEHVTAAHGFFNYGHFFYRLRKEYDAGRSKRKKTNKSWWGGKPTQDPRDLLEKHAAILPSAMMPLGKLGESAKDRKTRRIKMSQSVIIDLDPMRKSDRAEVALLHADIIHNARNAFHFELNWLGVTAGLLDELRAKCAAQAERYGLRFVEAPVEQIKDVSLKSAYRAPIPIPLALAPPVVPDLHLRLAEQGSSGQTTNWFEYAILTHKFGFVLDVEASSRYPDHVQVEYSYRGTGAKAAFEYSQFCHKSGLALVQCIGGQRGFLWCDNRLFIAAPTRGRAGGSAEAYPNMPVPAKLTKQEEARALRLELEAFCNDAEALRAFWDEVTPPLPESAEKGDVHVEEEGDKDVNAAEDVEGQREKQGQNGVVPVVEEQKVVEDEKATNGDSQGPGGANNEGDESESSGGTGQSNDA